MGWGVNKRWSTMTVVVVLDGHAVFQTDGAGTPPCFSRPQGGKHHQDEATGCRGRLLFHHTALQANIAAGHMARLGLG